MFEKVIVVDARGHLLGRLASYVAKQLLSGKFVFIQAKELLLCDAKELISLALFSGTKLNSQNFYAKDSLPTPPVLLSTTGHLLAFSGEASEECSLTKLPVEQLPSENSKYSKVFPPPMTPPKSNTSQMP